MIKKGRKKDRVKEEMANTRKILVVEDDEGLSRLIAKYLRNTGFDVAVANSGTQAIDWIAGNPTDLVLLDYRLGDMSATQIVEVFNERQFKIPFVIMTGHGDEKIAVEMMKSGARDYIVKEGEFFGLLPSVAKRIFEELQNEEKLTQANKALEESERKYRSIVDNALVGIYKTNLSGNILYANKALSMMLGYESPEELMLYNVLQIYKNKNDRDVLFDKLKRSGGVDEFECEFISKNGDTLNIVMSATLDGDTVSGMIMNITERRMAMKKLKQSKEKYRALIQTIPDIIYKIDLDGYFTFVNHSIICLGYDPKWLVGKHFSVILHPDDIETFSNFIVFPKYANKVTGDKDVSGFFDKRRMRESMIKNMEVRLLQKLQETGTSNTTVNENPITYYCAVTATGDYELDVNTNCRKLIGTLGIIRDISEKIRLQAENVRASQLAMIGELAAGASHEINNPIYGIINYAQLIADESDEDSRAHKFGKLIIEEGNRIADITQNLLSLSRSKTSEKRPVQIYELFSNSLKLTKVQLEKDNIIIKDNIPKDIPAIIANPQEIHQVFLNLIQNARYALNEKYPGKDKDKILEISCNKMLIDDYPYVRILFYDRGIGIPENILSKVTNPFFTTKPQARGTGLGLSISQNIVNNHDGKITIESIHGEFTNIIIDLPVEKFTTK